MPCVVTGLGSQWDGCRGMRREGSPTLGQQSRMANLVVQLHPFPPVVAVGGGCRPVAAPRPTLSSNRGVGGGDDDDDDDRPEQTPRDD